MLKQQFEILLAAEREASERIAEAELQAKRTMDDARAKRGERISQAREEALREVDAILEQARAESATEKARILAAAHAKADALLAAAGEVDEAFVQRAARSIAGIDP